MSIKEQFGKIKENWLLVLIIVVILGTSSFTSGGLNSLTKSVSNNYASEFGSAAGSALMARSSYGSDFAPEVESRKIVKNSRLISEVKRGTFHDNEAKLKAIISSSDSFLLNENVNKKDSDRRTYSSGSYQIKVDTEKYDAVILQLKEIGEITYFSENAVDITGRYTNVEVDLTTEKAKLQRYQDMYDEAEEVSDKITLNDRIFDQQKRIGYLEDSLKNLDDRIEYSTVSFTLKEKQSDYATVVFVKFASLIKSLVSSFNTLFWLIFVLVPWGIAALLIWFISKFFRRRN